MVFAMVALLSCPWFSFLTFSWWFMFTFFPTIFDSHGVGMYHHMSSQAPCMAHRHRWWHTSTSSRDLCFFSVGVLFFLQGWGCVSPSHGPCINPLAAFGWKFSLAPCLVTWSSLPKTRIWWSSMWQHLGKKKNWRRHTRTHTHIPAFRIWADMQHPKNMFAGHSIDFDLAGWLYFHHCPQQGPVW